MARKRKITKYTTIKLEHERGFESEKGEKVAGDRGFFRAFLRPWPFKSNEPEFNLKHLRQLLSDEKAKILYVIKTKKPVSIYALARILGRDFKAVSQDVRLLEHFGFILLKEEQDKKGKELSMRKRLRPVLNLDKLQISIEI